MEHVELYKPWHAGLLAKLVQRDCREGSLPHNVAVWLDMYSHYPSLSGFHLTTAWKQVCQKPLTHFEERFLRSVHEAQIHLGERDPEADGIAVFFRLKEAMAICLTPFERGISEAILTGVHPQMAYAIAVQGRHATPYFQKLYECRNEGFGIAHSCAMSYSMALVPPSRSLVAAA